jgi:hypothetical protein
MDKGTVNLREAIGNPGKAEAIEREIEGIRQNLDDLVTELDHRRHQLNPMVLIGHHPLVVAAAGVVLLGAVTGGVGLFRTRQRKAKRIFYSWGARGKRMGQAIGRLAREPAAAVPDAPSIGKRLFAVGVSAAVAVVAGRMARRFIRRMP